MRSRRPLCGRVQDLSNAETILTILLDVLQLYPNMYYGAIIIMEIKIILSGYSATTNSVRCFPLAALSISSTDHLDICQFGIYVANN